MPKPKFHPDANRRISWYITYGQHKRFRSLYEKTTHKSETAFFKELFEWTLENYKEDSK
jgi:hypothetical protein|tara:strand:- start:291 stop:467 length:177 start_codon:yes stop_codon:yes gene_type:complete